MSSRNSYVKRVVFARSAMKRRGHYDLAIQVVELATLEGEYVIRLVSHFDDFVLPGSASGNPEKLIERAKRLVIEF